jgi:hypothetical protein
MTMVKSAGVRRPPSRPVPWPVRFLVRPGRGAVRTEPAATYAIWGRWEGRAWLRLGAILAAELELAGYRPAGRGDVPDILICGPGAPRLAAWTPRRVARWVVGVVPARGAAAEPGPWGLELLRHRAWDAAVHLAVEGGSPLALVVGARGEETRLAGRGDADAFARALAHLLIAQARGQDAGAAGF